jgi:hypothetical protein
MTLIRPATADDIDRLVELGVAFHASTPYRAWFAADPEAMRRLATWAVEHGAVFVAEDGARMVGMIGMAVSDHLISGEPYASELFWFVSPDARGSTGIRLLKVAEKWARAQGARSIQMTAPDDHAAAIYERLHYRLMERVFVRALE